MKAIDQNGNRVYRRIRKESDGTWGANVWFGGLGSIATNLRRYYYRTRTQAENADISDESGLIRTGQYKR